MQVDRNNVYSMSVILTAVAYVARVTLYQRSWNSRCPGPLMKNMSPHSALSRNRVDRVQHEGSPHNIRVQLTDSAVTIPAGQGSRQTGSGCRGDAKGVELVV